MTKIVNKEIYIYLNVKWNKMLSKLRPGDKSFWRVRQGKTRGKQNLKIPHYNTGNLKIISDKKKHNR